MPTLAYDVILNRKNINTVFYSIGAATWTRAELEDDIKRSLINHDGYDSSIKVRLASRITTTDYDLEGDYGQGWEVLTSDATCKGIRQTLKEYRENKGGNYRIKKRMVSVFA